VLTPGKQEASVLLETFQGINVYSTYRRCDEGGNITEINRFDSIIFEGKKMYLAYAATHPGGGLFGVACDQLSKFVYGFKQVSEMLEVSLPEMSLREDKLKIVPGSQDNALFVTQGRSFLNSDQYFNPYSRVASRGCRGGGEAAAAETKAAAAETKAAETDAARIKRLGAEKEGLAKKIVGLTRSLSQVAGKLETSEGKRKKLDDTATKSKDTITKLRGEVAKLKNTISKAQQNGGGAKGKSGTVHALEVRVASLTAQVGGLNNTIVQLQTAFAAAPGHAAAAPLAAQAQVAPAAPNAAALTAILGALLNAR